MKIEKKRQFDLIQTFYRGTGEQNEVLVSLRNELREVVDSEASVAKVTLSKAERDSECVFALLAALEDCFAQRELDLVDRFKVHLRRQLRGLVTKKSHVSIDDVAVLDDSPDPLEMVITKEQVWLAKQYLRRITKPKVVEQFLRHFMDGTSFRQIALEDGEPERSLSIKLNSLFTRLQKYMVRINNV